MGKIRVATLGDETQEQEQKKKAEARRIQKAAKKTEEKNKEPKAESAKTEEPTAEPETNAEGKEKKREVKVHQYSKRYKEISGVVDKTKLYSLKEATKLVKKTSTTKFDGTVEVHLNLSLQALNNKPDYRGNVQLPHGTGKKINVVVVDEEVLKKLEAGTIDFDILVCHPSMMSKLAKFARVLGPKGLMPNPKNGTVHPDPEKRAVELSAGEVNFKTEPNNPIVHLGIGKASFEEVQLTENIQALIKAIGKHRIARLTLSSTMGPGIKVDLTAL